MATRAVLLLLAAAAASAAAAPAAAAPANATQCDWNSAARTCSLSPAGALLNATAPAASDAVTAAVVRAWAANALCNMAATATACAANSNCTYVAKSVRRHQPCPAATRSSQHLYSSWQQACTTAWHNSTKAPTPHPSYPNSTKTEPALPPGQRRHPERRQGRDRLPRLPRRRAGRLLCGEVFYI